MQSITNKPIMPGVIIPNVMAPDYLIGISAVPCNFFFVQVVMQASLKAYSFFSQIIEYTVSTSKRGNQLPVSAARWQHGSQICFTTFIY